MRRALLAAVIAITASAAAAAQDEAMKEPAAVYAELCGMCHRAGGMGTGLIARRLPPEQAPLEAREDLTPELVTLAVRRGIGNMPPLSRAEVSDAALAAIAAYLTQDPQALEDEP